MMIGQAESLRPRRILVVEDDRDFAESLIDLLEPLGFAVCAASSVSEAIDSLATFAADVALIDVKLGAEDGVGLIPELKGRSPALVCILMTAYAALDSAVEAVKNGAHDYLFKPLDPALLANKLSRAIDEREEQARRQREQRLILMGNLCAGVAHDVNNCLQVMLNEVGDLDLALSEQPPDTERATQSTEALLASLRTAAEVCARILTFAKGTPVSQGADASKVLRESMPILSKLTRPKVMLSVDAAEAPLWVPLDATQLQQVIMNLVLNACHAVGDSGTIRVELGEDGDRAEPSVRLRVVDQGCGIPSAILPRIFDPYFSTRPGSEGTGLGLSIVHGMVRAAGGEILVDSEVGRGTRFDVILPKGMPAKHRAAPPSALAAPSPSPSPTSAQHVLIVDDFSPILGAMDKAFRIAGYSNVCVGSAEEALSWLESGSPEICGLVSDVRLPGMSGLELAERLRARWPELPIVFLSGDVGNVPQLAKLGQRMAVLSKPFQLKALVECFQALCQTAPLLT